MLIFHCIEHYKKKNEQRKFNITPYGENFY